MNKFKLSIFLSVMMALAVAGAASAETGDNTTAIIEPPVVTAPAVVAENAPDRELKLEKRIEKIKARGAKLIAERLRVLNKAKAKAQSGKSPNAHSADVIALVDTNVAGLSALGVQIKASTNASTSKELVKQIYSNFRIYAVVMPKIQAYNALDQQTNFVNKVTERFTKVQARIDAAKAKGKDVTARQKALDDAKAKLATVAPKISELIAKVVALKPADYPTTSKTVITEIRTGIKANHLTFQQVNQLLKVAK
jgi:hypothetical protein